MRTDILPLCDQHYHTMEPVLAPYNADYSIEFFRCTDKFCHRCFGERIGYSTPKRGDALGITLIQPHADKLQNSPAALSSAPDNPLTGILTPAVTLLMNA